MPQCPTCRRRLPAASFCPFDGTELPRAVAVGSVVGGRYRLLAELGRGATGVVYRAWQTDLGRPVAVKVLHAEHVAHRELRQRFAREVEVVARLSHPGIVALHDGGETDTGVPYLVMDLVDGSALDQIQATAAPVGTARALSWVRQIAAALSAAHSAGVIHRDLKLGNVLLTRPPGLDEQVKLVDFGLAKVLESKDIALTRTGAVYGTPEYMAPEQATGGTIDERTDLYAVGVILFRLLTGELPYRGSGMGVVVSHIEDPVPDPRERTPAIAEPVAELCTSLMAKDPAERPQSAGEVLAWIDRLRGGLSRPAIRIPSGSDTLAALAGSDFVHQSPDHGRFHWLPALLVLLVALGLGSLYWTQGGGEVAGTRAPVDESTAPERRPEAPPRYREFIASGAHGSVRVRVPETIRAGQQRTALVEVWDASGEPRRAELMATMPGPDGVPRELPVGPGDAVGHYQIALFFDGPGLRSLELLVDGDTSVRVPVEVSGGNS